MCCLSLRWKISNAHAKSDVYSQDNKFGVAFKLYKVPAPNYFSEKMRQHMCIWAILTEKSRWEIGKCGPPELRGIGVVVPSWGWLTCWPSFQRLGVWVYKLANLPWLYELAICCLFLRRQGRISHDPSDFSTKETTFGVTFEGCKSIQYTKALRARVSTLKLFPQL